MYIRSSTKYHLEHKPICPLFVQAASCTRHARYSGKMHGNHMVTADRCGNGHSQRQNKHLYNDDWSKAHTTQHPSSMLWHARTRQGYNEAPCTCRVHSYANGIYESCCTNRASCCTWMATSCAWDPSMESKPISMFAESQLSRTSGWDAFGGT